MTIPDTEVPDRYQTKIPDKQKSDITTKPKNITTLNNTRFTPNLRECDIVTIIFK